MYIFYVKNLTMFILSHTYGSFPSQDPTPHSPYWMREWPNAWEDIDEDLWA